MAAGPSREEVLQAHKAQVNKMAREVGLLAGIAPNFDGRGMDYHGVVGTVTIRSRFIRASNGEASLWATASSPKGSLTEPPWMPRGCTAKDVFTTLI